MPREVAIISPRRAGIAGGRGCRGGRICSLRAAENSASACRGRFARFASREGRLSNCSAVVRTKSIVFRMQLSRSSGLGFRPKKLVIARI